MSDRECPICGCSPMGEGCSHQCPNSVHYYSPEQERADDAFYGDDDVRERYAGEVIDAEYEQECADLADAEQARINPNPATAEEQIADLDAHYPGGFRAWYMPNEPTSDTNPDDIPF